jgi:4-aminobutyrate aminotransferase-like enzyme/Ser/Thr protein kinase RdoA (MazF antagonist)
MQFASDIVKDWVSHYYGLSVIVQPINGYDEQNFILVDTEGKKYIAKIATDAHGLSFLDAQIKIINHLSKSPLSERFQHYLLNKAGAELTGLLIDGVNYYIRILSFLEGVFWVDAKNHPEALYHDLGSFLGKMDKALENFSHPAMHRHYTWDIATATNAWLKLDCIKDHERRRIAGYFLLQFETEVLPALSNLRHAYIHNDANDYNVLVKDDRINGLIDFGDMVYSPLINNLAVACTYGMLNNTNPLASASLLVKAYHEVYPLKMEEVDLLYYLIAGRLCISVTQSAYNSQVDSNNEHHFITEAPAWDLLYKFIQLNPVKAQDAFRRACGFERIIKEEDGYAYLMEQRNKMIGPNLSISYRKKLKITKGALQYLYDDKGHTYIDCVNNPSHVGHCHPVVVKRMQQQLARLNTNSRYLHDAMLQYAKKLTDTLPSALQVCYFCNSGSEANDLAVRMSRHFTGQKDIIVLDHAYHGTSTVAMEMSPYKFDGKGGAGKMPWIHKAMNPDMFRGQFRYGDLMAGEKYAADVQRIIEQLDQEQKKPAVFICETLLGVGGQMPLPSGYLNKVYEYVRAAGGICIADEVQVGFGRVGEAFWGFELQEVVPDIVVMGKPIGNGHPLAAVVVKKEIANAFNNGMEYFNTYGGNPVSMVTGMAVLDTIQQEEMQAHAKVTGDYLMEGLRNLMDVFPMIADVRGHGLFIGAELVKDRESKAPAVPEIDLVVEKMKDRGFLLSTDGPLHNVLKIKPPMPFSIQNAAALLENLTIVMSEL